MAKLSKHIEDSNISNFIFFTQQIETEVNIMKKWKLCFREKI